MLSWRELGLCDHLTDCFRSRLILQIRCLIIPWHGESPVLQGSEGLLQELFVLWSELIPAVSLFHQPAHCSWTYLRAPEGRRGKGSSAVNWLLSIPVKSDGGNLQVMWRALPCQTPRWACPLCVECATTGFWDSIKQKMFAIKGLSLQECNAVAHVDRIRSDSFPSAFISPFNAANCDFITKPII